MSEQAQLDNRGIEGAPNQVVALVGEMAVDGMRMNAYAADERITRRYSSAILANPVNQIYDTEFMPGDIFRVEGYTPAPMTGRGINWPVFAYGPRPAKTGDRA